MFALLQPLLALNVAGDDMETLRTRLYDYYLNYGDCTQMNYCYPVEGGCAAACQDGRHYVATIDSSNYTWSDVDYKDQNRSSWKTIEHLRHLQAIAQTLQCDACGLSPTEKKTFTTNALGSFRWWLNKDPSNPNWWWQDFGTPQYLAVAAFLLANYTTAQDIQKTVTIMHRADSQFPDSGQNGVWAQQIGINRGLLENNETLVNSLFQMMWNRTVLQLNGAEGIQPDGIFFQHKNLVQNGAYGSDSFLNLVVYAAFTLGTKFEIPINNLFALNLFVLDGEQHMIWWDGKPGDNGSIWWDISVKGREITRAPLGVQWMVKAPLQPALQALGASSVDRHDEWLQLALRVEGKGKNLVKTKHFWTGDYTSHQRPNFFASVKMLSNRTLSAESTNDEGMKSWHLSDGVTLLYQRGDEYAGIFPVWDWTALPGTTLRQKSKEQLGNVNVAGLTTFVGGCISLTRNVGVSAFDYHSNNFGDPSEKVPLKARKSWFWLEDGYVALGAGITLTDATLEVATTLEQSLLKSAVLIDGKELSANSSTAIDAAWVHHNEVLYLASLSAPTVRVNVSNKQASGSWYDINYGEDRAIVTKDVFKLQVSHGKAPNGSSYSYAALPGVASSHAVDVASKFRSNFQLRSNTPSLQAITYYPDALSEHFMAAFYEPTKAFEDQFQAAPGSRAAPLTVYNVSVPILLTLTEDSGGTLFVYASEPTHSKIAQVSFVVNRSVKSSIVDVVRCTPDDKGYTTVVVGLPSAPFAGATIYGSCVHS